MSKLKKVLSVLLSAIMLVTMVPSAAFAQDEMSDADLFGDSSFEDSDILQSEQPQDISEPEEMIGAPEAEEPEFSDSMADEFSAEEEAAYSSQETDTITITATQEPRNTSQDEFYKIVHVDAGRKYFSPENIKAIIDTAAAAGYNQVELYLSDNQGFRFALDDMNVTTSTGNTYDLKLALGDGYSDGSKCPDGSGKYLTQSEMTNIISYAGNKGIDIVPCINVPGHMGAILEEFPQFEYSGSKSSIDLENTEAVAFALAITEKYATYFEKQGVKYYNLGADEYANDLSTMGFQGLYTSGKYQEFVDFLNNAAQIVINHGMTPRAFNDGICYNNITSYAINTNIQVCYWSSGWSGYNVASAATLNNAGYQLINTHGDYYWVLGNSSWQCSAEKASDFNYKSFQGGTIDNPAGAMFCIWCDVGNANGTDGGTAVVNATKDVITAFGETLPSTETEEPETSEDKTVYYVDGENQVSVTAPGLTSLTCEPVTDITVDGAQNVLAFDMKPMAGDESYTSQATVSIKVPQGWNTANMGAFVVEDGGTVEKLTGSYDEKNGVYTYKAPHFSIGGIYDVAPAESGDDNTETTENKTITVTVGGTETATISGANYAGTYKTEDPSIATVEVTGKDATEATTSYNKASVTCNDLISHNSNSNSNSWTAASGYYYKVGDENYYPVYAKRRGFIWYTYTWGYSTTDSTSDVTQIGEQSALVSDHPNITVYTQSKKDATPASTTVTFTGLTVGTTHVRVGNTRYTINVVAEDLSKAKPLTVEYWITNLPVTADGATSKEISAQSAYGEYGVNISTLVPETGTYTYGSVVYWKGTVLDSDNKQTNKGGSENDKTGSGKDFKLVRYYNGNWQYYYEAYQTWYTISSTDQVVIYWLQPTEVTKEITTLVKDWGFSPDNQGDKVNKVALTVAVVYPDGTVSPAEGDMYSTSTTLFNYWSNRDIGLVAPVNNSDYEISKITVTDGKRDQSGIGKWGANDSITWNKVINEAGDEWYDETTCWDETVGGTPMVNGATSKITWSKYNTAKLVLIYLKPVHYDTNLIVKWVDDSANGAEISHMEIAVSSDGDEITFKNGLKQKSEINAGTFKLDDDAYITNSSNVNQPINKNISTIPGVADQYKSGLYKYVSAEMSQDFKTMTLHYNVDPNKLRKQYVIDFGLPVKVPLSDLVDNPADVVDVSDVSSNASYDPANKVIIYKPSAVLKDIEPVTFKIQYKSSDILTRLSIGFVPATTVYYEETFMDGLTPNDSSCQQTQKASDTGVQYSNYGYDTAYDSTVGSSMSNVQQIDSGMRQFSFTGTGVDIYTTSTSGSGRLLAYLYQGETLKKIYSVDTHMEQGTTDATSGQNGITAYNVPVISCTGLEHGSYTVKLQAAKNTTVEMDGFRVYNTLKSDAANKIYERNGEENPTFGELRNCVLGSYLIDDKKYSDKYADQIAKDTLSQVYSSADKTKGVLVLSKAEQYNDDQLKDLLDNGPKNELYVFPGQTVTFTLNNGVSAQIGLKALNAPVKFSSISGIEGFDNNTLTLSTSTDMFYKINSTSGEVTISVSGDTDSTGILSITKIKAFGVSSTANIFADVSEDTLMPALLSMGYQREPVATPVPTQSPAPTESPVPTQSPAPTVTPVPKDPTPAAVTLKKITAVGTNSALITWNKVDNADGYLVYRRTGSANWKKIATVNKKTTSYTDKKLRVGTKYTYTVRAYRKVKGTVYKGAYDKKGLSIIIVPKTPVLKHASKVSGKAIQVSWSKVSDASGYVVYRKLYGSKKWSKVATLKNGAMTSYKDKNVKSGKTYIYTVRAYKIVNTKKIYSGYDSKGIKKKL